MPLISFTETTICWRILEVPYVWKTSFIAWLLVETWLYHVVSCCIHIFRLPAPTLGIGPLVWVPQELGTTAVQHSKWPKTPRSRRWWSWHVPHGTQERNKPSQNIALTKGIDPLPCFACFFGKLKGLVWNDSPGIELLISRWYPKISWFHDVLP